MINQGFTWTTDTLKIVESKGSWKIVGQVLLFGLLRHRLYYVSYGNQKDYNYRSYFSLFSFKAKKFKTKADAIAELMLYPAYFSLRHGLLEKKIRFGEVDTANETHRATFPILNKIELIKDKLKSSRV